MPPPDRPDWQRRPSAAERGLFLITVSFTYLFGLKSNVAHALMVAALTLLICAILFTIGEFNYAFSGVVEIRPEAFREVLRGFGGT